MKVFITLFICIFLFFSYQNPSIAQDDNGSFSIRGGLGTDINGGLGYGFGLGYKFPYSNFELTAVLFAHSSEETTEDFHTYTETTDLFVYGIMGNYLIGYRDKMSGWFGVVGIGFAAISVDWEESSPTDESLGTPLPGGGSKQSESGTGGGSVINAGFGYSFGNLSLRAEFPVIFAFSPPGGATGVAPTFIAMLSYTF
ncbi:MAG: hypothetical protein P8X47_06615 [Ignavibacteriaceae bacterium]